MLTLAYITGRENPMIQWFFDSLMSPPQTIPLGSIAANQIIVVDRFRDQRDESFKKLIHDHRAWHVEPKPNVWQGRFKLTREDWWAMASCRNTALCMARDGYICFLDDLSVLMPRWLESVKEAMSGNYIACGAYKKVKNLEVENGVVKSFEPYSDDSRMSLAPDVVGPCTGDWLYGCSCAFPVEALLTVGGWPEICDGLGSEDTTLGIVLGNSGFHLKYDKRMMTYEAEDLHGWEWKDGQKISGPLKRTDKGVSPNDKSHAIVSIARKSKYFPNYYEGGMRAMREHVLKGNPFPIVQIPDRDWYDQQLLSEM